MLVVVIGVGGQPDNNNVLSLSLPYTYRSTKRNKLTILNKAAPSQHLVVQLLERRVIRPLAPVLTHKDSLI
jgi:hypothetical protein